MKNKTSQDERMYAWIIVAAVLTLPILMAGLFCVVFIAGIILE